MASTFSMLVSLVLLGLASPVAGNAFLEKSDALSAQMLSQAGLEQLLLEEVHGFMGKGRVDEQLPAIKAALEPMWLALPKNADGNLDSAQVRYALHRFFVQRHGWHIDGLDRVGAGSSEAAATDVLRQRVPGFLMDRFEEAFGLSGLKLHELAIFAATLEHVIHDEAVERLKDVYEALAKSTDEELSEGEVDTATDAYMMSLLLGQDRLKSNGSIAMKLARLRKAYPGWADTQLWLRDVEQTVAHFDQGRTNPFVTESGLSFNKMERVVSEVSERFGSFQDGECRHLKDTLLEAEEQETGRVRLSDFYKKGLEMNVHFKENADFLRQQGALDESKAGEPRVIVSNYVLSQANCLADTGFYSICCINECEGLLAHVERAVAAPQASPERIAAIVANLSTSTIEAPGALSPSMLNRLKEVAGRHGGSVPLHSRLFAQWLHFVFPRECPYPHMSGTTNPLTPAEWMKTNTASPNMKQDHMVQYIDSAKEQDASAPKAEVQAAVEEEEELVTQWSHEEEILFLPSEQQPKASKFFSYLGRAVLAVAVLAGVAVAVTDTAKRCSGLESRSEKVHLV